MIMQPKPFLPRYPAIVSSINGRRRPGKAEIRTVAVRIFHEIHGIGPNRTRRLRQALLIARGALGLGPSSEGASAMRGPGA